MDLDVRLLVVAGHHIVIRLQFELDRRHVMPPTAACAPILHAEDINRIVDLDVRMLVVAGHHIVIRLESELDRRQIPLAAECAPMDLLLDTGDRDAIWI